MATTESHPGVHSVSIQRSRSAQLADQGKSWMNILHFRLIKDYLVDAIVRQLRQLHSM